MALTWFSTVVDCRDPQALAGFWCQVLGYQVIYQNEREVDIAPGRTRSLAWRSCVLAHQAGW